MEIRRYVQRLSPHVLPKVVLEKQLPLSEPVANVDEFDAIVASWRERSAAGPVPPSSDTQLARELHGVLNEIDERVLVDERLWQWMTTVPFAEYTSARWIPGLSDDPELLQKPAAQKRFLGGGSLNGMSRNAVGRLFWAAQTLWTPEDGYRWSDVVLGNQDFYSAVFERNLGLYAPLAVVAARLLEHADEGERRETLKNLNHVMTTVVVESLVEDDLAQLVESCRP
ncbi:MAG: DUF6339 family protein [Acidimicrobiales bacterium]|nr:DUF6339 family protein [Acidimicrobiales bacterium]